jgi:hypothetical protein
MDEQTPPRTPSPEPLSPKSGHDSWPALVGDTERTDQNEKLAPARVVTPRGSDVPSAVAPMAPPAETPAPAPAAVAPAEDDEDDGAIAVREHKRGQPGKPLSPSAKRINELTYKQREAERREADALARIRELEAQLSGRGRPASAEPAAPAPNRDPDRPKPSVNEFQTYEDFVDALTDWKTDRAVRAVFAAQAQHQAETQQSHADQSFAERRDAWVKEHPDFNDIVGQMDHVPVSPPMEQFFKHDPAGISVIDYLARHPEDGIRIAQLAPGPAFVALGRIAQTIEAHNSNGNGAVSPGRPTPKAPPPITPVGAGQHRSTDPADLDFGPEYVRRGNEADRQRRRAGLR